MKGEQRAVTATILQFRPKRDPVQDAIDAYVVARYPGGMDSLPLIVRTAFFEAQLRLALLEHKP